MEEGDAEAAITGKMRDQDYAGARTLLLETLQTNPRLESAVEMLSVLEVLCAAGKAYPGRGVDWYRVLQVLPEYDDARIEAQYRRIISQVEPVVGDLPGAELALRFLKEAYAVLSDPEKRAQFDSKDKFAECIRSVGFDRPTVNNKIADSVKLNGLHTRNIGALDVTNKAVSHVQHTVYSCSDKKNSHLSNVASSSKTKMMDPGFHGDGVELHFASSSKTKRVDPCFQGDGGELQSLDNNPVDKKQKGVCETDMHCMSPSQVEFDGCIADLSDAEENGQCSSKQYDYHNFQDDRAIECFAAGQVWAAYDWDKFPRRYALITEILIDKMQLYVSWFKPYPQSHEENKWSRAGLPFVCGTFVLEECGISLTCPTMFSHQIYNDNMNQHLQVYPQKGEVWAIYSDWDIGWCADPGMCKKNAFSVVEILTSYSKESGCTMAHLVKVNGYRSVFRRYLNCGTVHSENLLMFSHRVPSFRLTHEVGTMFELEHSAVPENRPHENTLACVVPLPPLPGFHSDTNGFSEAAVAQFSNISSSNIDRGAPQQGMMNCNNKLSPEDFMDGQIWAVYDSRDMMPRSYVRIIHMVSCTSVFVLKLEPHPMLNEEIQWVEDGLPVACGVFRAGTETTYKDIWEFSHPVQCDWSAKRSFYKIFPKKGEIWAVYKNWNVTLNSIDIDKCEPRMVEILTDYSDENGVNACCLARVNGCLTFFHRVVMEGFHLTKWITRSEMLSFSHRVPAFIIIEIKDHNIPKGSWHLEPNALPTRIVN